MSHKTYIIIKTKCTVILSLSLKSFQTVQGSKAFLTIPESRAFLTVSDRFMTVFELFSP
jgi:hypothetical protein